MHTKTLHMLTAILLGSMRLLSQTPQPATVETIPKVQLRPAHTGRPYAQSINTTDRAYFEKVGGDSWLVVTQEGELTGTPFVGANRLSTITVCAHADKNALGGPCEGKDLKATFAVRVQSCAVGDGDRLAWCGDEPAQSASPQHRPPAPADVAFQVSEGIYDGMKVDLDRECNEGCIVQFDRLNGALVKGTGGGRLGHYNSNIHRTVNWDKELLQFPVASQMEVEVINAINGSKVFLSGSVLIHKNVSGCRFRSWSVLTETGDSSNNLYYGPSDLNVFCAEDGHGEDSTVLIVLPSHAIWADVYGTRANTNDPYWKPLSGPPPSHECWTGAHRLVAPTQGIQPCDQLKPLYQDKNPSADNEDWANNKDENSTWLVRTFLYSPPIEWLYNRGTQPGVSQGSISIAPIADATKSTWDVQTYGSSLLGPGWIGLQGVYERDRNPKDDLNSFIAALTYDYRIENRPPHWRCLASEARNKCTPPPIAVRPLELTARIGPEWAPDSFKYKAQYLPRSLNIVAGATLRLPIVLSPKLPGAPRLPSEFTIVPTVGLEGGERVVSHLIGRGVACTSAPDPLCARQPQSVFRHLAGVDVGIRIPYSVPHTFFGDRSPTLDFSYRMRWLHYAEPFANAQYLAFNVADPPPAEGQSAGDRLYARLTFIVPVSAYFQLRTTFQHGSLPPSFQYVGDQITFGFTFSNPGSSEL